MTREIHNCIWSSAYIMIIKIELILISDKIDYKTFYTTQHIKYTQPIYIISLLYKEQLYVHCINGNKVWSYNYITIY